MTPHELEDLIRGIPWPGPSAEARERVLSEAALSPTRVIWSDRMWFSRGWRMCAAAATVALVGMSLWSGRIESDRALTRVLPSADTALESFIRDAGFAEDDARAVARRSRAGARPPGMEALRVALEPIEGGS